MLRQTRVDPMTLPLALNLAALILFLLGSIMTLMSVSTAGQQTVATLLSGPISLEQSGLWELSLVVILTTVAVPLARVLCTLTVLLGLRLPHPPRELRSIFAWAEFLRPWSMIEIYLLGAFVAYVKLSDMTQVDLGVALYALAGLMVVMVAADVAIDDQAVWETLEPRKRRPSRWERPAGTFGTPLSRIGCHTCGLVSRASPGAHCPRCGFALRYRKWNSIARAWALLIAAALLYVPANVYPVMTVIRLGAGGPSTIIGGVHELILAGMWPLAALVFTASIVVPLLKLFGLSLLLVSTQFRWRTRLRERTVLYRVVDLVGRWSMIDVFMVSILVALVQFGAIAMVRPGVGATAFAAVVILTMFAAASFDPRLMWDAAQRARKRRP
jgi:paraquat-inducible protein A